MKVDNIFVRLGLFVAIVSVLHGCEPDDGDDVDEPIVKQRIEAARKLQEEKKQAEQKQKQMEEQIKKAFEQKQREDQKRREQQGQQTQQAQQAQQAQQGAQQAIQPGNKQDTQQAIQQSNKQDTQQAVPKVDAEFSEGVFGERGGVQNPFYDADDDMENRELVRNMDDAEDNKFSWEVSLQKLWKNPKAFIAVIVTGIIVVYPLIMQAFRWAICPKELPDNAGFVKSAMCSNTCGILNPFACIVGSSGDGEKIPLSSKVKGWFDEKKGLASKAKGWFGFGGEKNAVEPVGEDENKPGGGAEVDGNEIVEDKKKSSWFW